MKAFYSTFRDATITWGRRGTTFVEPVDFLQNYCTCPPVGGAASMSNASAPSSPLPERLTSQNNFVRPSSLKEGPIVWFHLIWRLHSWGGGQHIHIWDVEKLMPNQLTCSPPSWFMGGSNLAEVQLDFDPLGLLNGILCVPLIPQKNMSALLNNRPRYPAPWDYTQPTGHLGTPREGLTPMAMLEGSEVVNSLSMKTYNYGCLATADDENSDENESGGPKKRGRPSASRVQGGKRSTQKGLVDPPAMRTRKSVNAISKAAGRGAERLESTTAQGVYIPSTNSGTSCPAGVGGSP
jgi:hypothetical protein